jgi:alkylation response protein AidB-like acyl-CoA dehydrogenase
VVRHSLSGLIGEKHGGWPALSRVLDRGMVALCAEMCGGAQKVLDMTAAYANIRIAFGKPIGSHQGASTKPPTCWSMSRTPSR